MTQSPIPKPPTVEVEKPKLILIAMAALLAFVVAVYFFTLYVVFPDAGRALDIYLPSKAGGRSYYPDMGEFQTMSYIVIAITAFALGLAWLLISKGKYLGAATLALLFIPAAGFYAAVMLGNGFHELWRGGWSVVGMLLAIGIALGISTLVLLSFKQIKIEPTTKK